MARYHSTNALYIARIARSKSDMSTPTIMFNSLEPWSIMRTLMRFFGQRGEQLGGGAERAGHAPTHGRDQRQSALELERIGLHGVIYAAQQPPP